MWLGAPNCDGYGQIHIGERCAKAHRLAWFLHFGSWPKKHVLHSCDVPLCVRWDHLFLGDDIDNQADKVAKGRQARGEQNGRAKLTRRTAAAAKRAALCGIVTITEVARAFGISRRAIRLLCDGHTWQ